LIRNIVHIVQGHLWSGSFNSYTMANNAEKLEGEKQ